MPGTSCSQPMSPAARSGRGYRTAVPTAMIASPTWRIGRPTAVVAQAPTPEPKNAPTANPARYRAAFIGVRPSPIWRKRPVGVSEKPTMLPKKTIVKTTPETYDPLAQHAQLDQRGLAPDDPAALAAADDVEQRGRGRDHADQPDRPAQRAALDQREHGQEADHGGERDADPVEAGAAVGGLVGRQHATADDDREQADRDVDQEQRTPDPCRTGRARSRHRPRPDPAPSRGRSPDRTPRTPCRCRPDRRCRGSARRSAGSSPLPRAPGGRGRRSATPTTRRPSRASTTPRSRRARPSASACGRRHRRAGRRRAARPRWPGCTPRRSTPARRPTATGRAGSTGPRR